MRRLMTGALLMIVGVLAVLSAPSGGVTGCLDCIAGSHDPICGCHTFTTSLAVPITWSGDWGTLFLPMAIVGLAFVVTGIVLIVRARRSRVVLGGCIFGLGLVGILFSIPALPVGPILLISSTAVLLGLGVIATGTIPRTGR